MYILILAVGWKRLGKHGTRDKILPTMSRHIAAVGTRFRLLICGMKLLQGETIPRSISKNIMRQRIYSVALDYFCGDRSFPTQASNKDVNEDIQVLLTFWNMMHSDKKYFKIQMLSDGGEYTPEPTSHHPGGSFIVSNNYFESKF